MTCDENAALPDEIFGLPVTSLSDRALAHGAKPAEGEEVTVLGGAEGTLIRNIVLFSVLVYELFGPSLTKMALTKAGDIQAIPKEVTDRRKKRLEEVTKPVPAAFDK